ncbi:MAG: S41 family peptidase [Candidatus Flexifilum sp.]
MNLSHSNINQIGRSIVLGVGIGLMLAVVFVAGYVARDLIGRPLLMPTVLSASQDENEYALLNEVEAIVQRHFVGEIPSKTVREYAAIRAVLATLNDPYTFFIEPPVAASESQVLAGTYGGIGVQIVRTEDGGLELYPFPDGPAAAAGVQNGDRLLAVNGMPVDQSIPPDTLDQLLRGEVIEGNGVTITLMRGAPGIPFDLFVEFAVINVPSVIWRVLSEDPRIGYLQIERFTSRTPDETRTALAELQALGAGALVLDLRGNTGGLLQESIVVADEFIDSGVLVVERDTDEENIYEAASGGAGVGLPLVVLVNQRTASGAEIVAGALQDNQRALLIGQRTYGKGTVQQIFPLSDGSSIHVTSSEWFTPSLQPLDRVGLSPNIEIAPDPAGRDIELGEAVRQLQIELLSRN